jgi:hypothetical protein
MPFTEALLPRLPRTFEFWRRNPPCDDASVAALRALNVSFIFQCNRVITPPLARQLRALWASLGEGVTHCFGGGALLLSANQTDEEEANKIVAGCHQHYNTFAALHARGFDHWLQYETDVLPVRPGWLARVADEASRNAGCARWWVQGAEQGYSLPTVSKRPRIDGGMLNGNALYCINAEVLAYLDDVKAQFPPIGCHDNPRRAANARPLRRAPRAGTVGRLWGFDTVQYWYRTGVEQRAKMQGRSYLFQSVDWIADLHQMPRDEIEALLEARPSLVLLHAKSYFNNTRSSWDEGGGGSGENGGGGGAARRSANVVLMAVAAALAARLALLAARSSRTRLGGGAAAAQRK